MKIPAKILRLFSSASQAAMLEYTQWIFKKRGEHDKDLQTLISIQKQILDIFVKLSSANERLGLKVGEIIEIQSQTREKLGRLARSLNEIWTELQKIQNNPKNENALKSSKLNLLAREVIPAVLADQWNLKIRRCEPQGIDLDGKMVEFDLVIECLTNDEFPVTVFCEIYPTLTEDVVRNHLSKVRVVSRKINGEIRVIFFTVSANTAARRLIQQSGSCIIFTNGNFQQFPGNN